MHLRMPECSTTVHVWSNCAALHILLSACTMAAHLVPLCVRMCTPPPPPLAPPPAANAAPPAERLIAEKIQQGIKSQSIKVADTSGGCGAMYR
jgi:hypothetical protein